MLQIEMRFSAESRRAGNLDLFQILTAWGFVLIVLRT
jgi:hypothetical protein